jgi:hydrogenase expression/formation protein HypD
LRAEAEGTGNLSLFCNHDTIVPTMKAVLDSPDMHSTASSAPAMSR